MARPRAFDETEAIDAAMDCFWQRGFEATSVRDLARHMGITGTSLYNAFGDKRTLFAKSLERYCTRSTRERIARLEAAHPPREALEHFFAEIIDKTASDADRRGCFLVNSALDVAPHDPELGQTIGGYLDELKAFYRRVVSRGQSEGSISGDIDAEEMSSLLLAMLVGIRVLARVGADRPTLEAIARPVLVMLAPGNDRQQAP